MRRSASLLIPLSLILLYYAFWIGGTLFLIDQSPGLANYLPIGGISEFAGVEY